MLASRATGAFGVLLLYLAQKLLKLEGCVFDLGCAGEDTVPHGFVDDLDLVELVHSGCSEHLVIRFPDVISHELHLGQVAYNVNVVPSFGHSGENQRVVELPGPEEGDIVDWELLACHVQTSHRSLVNGLVIVLNSSVVASVPERIGGHITSSVYILLRGLQERIGLDSSFCGFQAWGN